MDSQGDQFTPKPPEPPQTNRDLILIPYDKMTHDQKADRALQISTNYLQTVASRISNLESIGQLSEYDRQALTYQAHEQAVIMISQVIRDLGYSRYAKAQNLHIPDEDTPRSVLEHIVFTQAKFPILPETRSINSLQNQERKLELQMIDIGVNLAQSLVSEFPGLAEICGEGNELKFSDSLEKYKKVYKKSHHKPHKELPRYATDAAWACHYRHFLDLDIVESGKEKLFQKMRIMLPQVVDHYVLH